jgi:hypothetical protein
MCLPSVEVTVYIFAEVRYSWGETPRPRESRFQHTGHHIKIGIEISRIASIPTPPRPKKGDGGREYRGSPSGRK